MAIEHHQQDVFQVLAFTALQGFIYQVWLLACYFCFSNKTDRFRFFLESLFSLFHLRIVSLKIEIYLVLPLEKAFSRSTRDIDSARRLVYMEVDRIYSTQISHVLSDDDNQGEVKNERLSSQLNLVSTIKIKSLHDELPTKISVGSLIACFNPHQKVKV